MGSNTAYSSFTYFANILHNPKRSSSLLVKLDPNSGATPAQISRDLNRTFEQAGIKVASISTLSEQKDNMRSNFNSILALLVMVALILAVVSSLGLMGAMSINVLERTREIGVLRAIGASNAGVTKVFMIESLLIGLTSYFFSITLAVPITSLIATLMGNLMMGSAMQSAYSTTGVWLWLVIVLVLSLVSNYLPSRNASRLTVREVLAYE